MKKLVVLFLLLATNAFADISTAIEHTTASTAWSYNPLGSPRSHVVCFSDSGHIAVRVGDLLILSYDNGQTFLDTNSISGENHTHVNIFDDIIYACMSTYKNGGSPIAMIYSDSGSGNDYLRTILYDTVLSPAFTTDGIGAIQKVPGTNYILAMLHIDTDPSDVLNDSYMLSSDTGATWSDSGLIVDVPNTVARSGLMASSTTLYYIGYWDDYIRWYKFNPADTTFSSLWNLATTTYSARDYSYTIFNDTILFAACQNEVNSVDSLWVYWGMYNINSTASYRDSFYIGRSNDSTDESMLGTTLTFMESGDHIYMTYLNYACDDRDVRPTTDDSIKVYGRYFQWSDSSWVGDTLLSQGYSITEPGTQNQTAPNIVPESHGAQTYVLYDATQYGGNEDCILTHIVLSETSTGDTLYTDTVTLSVDSLPYTCSTNRTLIKFSGDIDFTGLVGLTITADTVRVSGNGWGDTLTFNSLKHSGQEDDGDYSDIDSGFIMLAPSTYHVIFDSLVVIESTNEGDSLYLLRASAGSSSGQISNVVLRECHFHVKSNDAGNVYIYGADNCQIIGGNYTSFVDSFLRRDSEVMRSLYISGYPNDSVLQEGEYTCKLRGVVIDSCPHTGIGLLRGLFEVDSCYVWVNQHNLRYPTPDGQYHSANNAYGIGCTALMGGTYIRECSLQVRDSYEGGRGFYFDYNDPVIGDKADTTNPITISQNYVNVRTGPDVEYPNDSGTTWGFRVRYRVRGLVICSNYVEIRLDNNPATDNIGGGGAGLYINSDDTSTVDNQNTFRIFHNTVIAYADSTTFANGTFNVEAFAFVDTLATTPPSRSWGNRFITNMMPFKLGRFGSYWGEDFISIRDTFQWYDNRFTDFYGFTGCIGIGNTGNDAVNNKFYDPIFINCNDTNIVYTTTNGIVEAELYVTCTVTVIDSNSTPINGATVYLIDINNDTTSTLTTNASGLAIDTIMYWDKVWEDASAIDTTYNDFTVSGVYGEISADSMIEFTWNNKSVTVQLGTEAATVRYKIKGVKR